MRLRSLARAAIKRLLCKKIVALTMNRSIPAIDVKGLTEKEEDLQQLAAQIKDALTNIGFVAMTNHNISKDVVSTFTLWIYVIHVDVWLLMHNPQWQIQDFREGRQQPDGPTPNVATFCKICMSISKELGPLVGGGRVRGVAPLNPPLIHKDVESSPHNSTLFVICEFITKISRTSWFELDGTDCILTIIYR